jgi:predicted acyltransferase
MPSASKRVLSIDVLRGLTIALMILVNDPGDWSHVYAQLDHAEWNGFTLTDFVFPNFLFLVGVSIILSLDSRIARGDSKRSLALHMLRRALTIFAIKMFLSAFPHFHLTHLRIFGVLTRIAICYLIAGLICLITRRARALATITAALLIGYWALMRFVPVPGFGVPTHDMPILDPDRNLAAWLDRGFNAFTRAWLHTGSLYNKTHDPEGILSTIPSVATTLIGCLTGLWLRRATSPAKSAAILSEGGDAAAVEEPALSLPNGPRETLLPQTSPTIQPRALGSAAPGVPAIRTLRVLIVSGLQALTYGLLWSLWFPINKNLWTSSYVLFSAGWSLLLLALCYWLIDMRRLNDNPTGKWLLRPWLIFGSNAITAYCVSNFLVELAIWIKVPAGAWVTPSNPGKYISAWQWSYIHIFARHGSTYVTSVAFAVAFVALCFLPNWLLWRRKIFLKV